MANSTETQTVVEPVTQYCRTCGHAKEAHNLDFRGDPADGKFPTLMALLYYSERVS